MHCCCSCLPLCWSLWQPRQRFSRKHMPRQRLLQAMELQQSVVIVQLV
jgi:hypothetical protein